MSYSNSKLSLVIAPGARQSTVVLGGAEGVRGEEGMQDFIVSVILNAIAAALAVMKTTSKVI